MKTKNYTRLSAGWNGLYRRLPAVVIMTLALFVTSCGITRKSAESRREVKDSVVIREIQIVKTIPVPESKVEMVIPLENLRNLPEGAAYTKKAGQANVKVSADGDSLFVFASCDSLALQCEQYEKELVRIRSDTDKQITEVKKNTFQTSFKWCLGGFIAGIIITIIAIFIYKRKIYGKR